MNPRDAVHVLDHPGQIRLALVAVAGEVAKLQELTQVTRHFP